MIAVVRKKKRKNWGITLKLPSSRIPFCRHRVAVKWRRPVIWVQWRHTISLCVAIQVLKNFWNCQHGALVCFFDLIAFYYFRLNFLYNFYLSVKSTNKSGFISAVVSQYLCCNIYNQSSDYPFRYVKLFDFLCTYNHP